MSIITLGFTIHELLAIQDMVRQHQSDRRCHDTDDMRLIHTGILELLSNPNSSSEVEYQVDCNENFLWHIENQIPFALKMGTIEVGRSISLKVFKALQELQTQNRIRDLPIQIPLDWISDELLAELDKEDEDASRESS